MSWLAGWVKDLVVVVFFVSAAYMLLPENSLRHYARFVAGLVVIGALLTPVLQLLRWDPGTADWFGRHSAAGADRIVADGDFVFRQALERVTEDGRRRAAEHVASVIELALGAAVRDVDVRWLPDGGIERIEATVSSDDASAPDAERAVRLVAGYFGLNSEQVRVRLSEDVWQGGAER